jgi:CheY-like chemotaxis protein
VEQLKQLLFYFPTTVLFVDDDPTFLSNIGFEINDRTSLLFCEKSREVMPLLEGRPVIKDLAKKIMNYWNNSEDDLPASWRMKKAIQALHEEIYSPDRFSYISTLVIDYSMPGLNGAELCELLKNYPAKKIMLTGAADYNTAVQLFNSGLIDHFIVKDTPDMSKQLNESIHKAQQAYFDLASSMLLQSLPEKSACLDNSSYWKFINNFFSVNNFSEYYLVDGSGSLLFVDYFGNPTWMVMKSGQELEDFYEISIDNQASPEVVRSLKNKEKLPFFFSEEDQRVSVFKWDQYLHDATLLPGFDDLYYAIITNHKSYVLDQKKILSHRNFLEKE